MATANDAVVGIAPDGSGKSVRTREVQVLLNGALATVEMQVISLADSNGNLLNVEALFANYAIFRQMLLELRAIRLGMELMVCHGETFDAGPQNDLMAMAKEHEDSPFDDINPELYNSGSAS